MAETAQVLLRIVAQAVLGGFALLFDAALTTRGARDDDAPRRSEHVASRLRVTRNNSFMLAGRGERERLFCNSA